MMTWWRCFLKGRTGARPDAELDDKVEVHVTFLGGMYVDLEELLRSKAAQESIRKVNALFGTSTPDVPEPNMPSRNAE